MASNFVDVERQYFIFIAIGDGLLPAMRDPLFIEQRVEGNCKKIKCYSSDGPSLSGVTHACSNF